MKFQLGTLFLDNSKEKGMIDIEVWQVILLIFKIYLFVLSHSHSFLPFFSLQSLPLPIPLCSHPQSTLWGGTSFCTLWIYVVPIS